ncbi:hypothetical protein CAPTEDRAFT_228803 [Capitella teleta]|uniref:Uncharacterized protein n=1 Tax=Capitella teleta TaxID=283909 RepID=R7V6J5_CAPTE|nr:hypothetical protein CAPTEDRAFT_228803 [Capitella teleta]|eukprot:ELU11986.1 hypothetical protein CAPTEDRAFT_228803 [Capitella teleta]
MDWEAKFSSIVQETESNLAKVEHRLGSSSKDPSLFNLTESDDRNSSAKKILGTGYLNNLQPNPRTSQWPMSSSSFCYGEPQTKNNLSKALSLRSLRPSHYGSSGVHSESLFVEDATPEIHPSLDESEGVATVLQERIDEQNKTMKQMMKTIESLQEDRISHQNQLKELREEISSLKRNRGKKEEAWKEDISTELNLLQNQLQCYQRARNGENTSEAGGKSTIQRNPKGSERCDVERNRSSTRKIRVEISMREHEAEQSETNRQRDRLSKSINNLIEAQLSSTKNFSCLQLDGTKDEINELRSSYRLLRDKLDRVQLEIHQPASKPSVKPVKSTPKKSSSRQELYNLLSPNTSDLDLDLSLESEIPDLTLDPTLNYTDDGLEQVNTEGLETLDLRLTTLDSIDLTTEDFTDNEGEALSMDDLK